MKKLNNITLVIIDVQKGIDEVEHWGGNRNNPQAEANIASLLNIWREEQLPIIHIKHNSIFPASPFRPGQIGNEIKEIVQPLSDELILEKSTTNAFIGTALQLYLTRNQIDTLVMTGFVTNNSIEATARMAGDLGYKVWVVRDATATFDKMMLDGTKYSSDLVHLIALSNLKDEYAHIIDTQGVCDFLKKNNQ